MLVMDPSLESLTFPYTRIEYIWIAHALAHAHTHTLTLTYLEGTQSRPFFYGPNSLDDGDT